MSQEKNKVLYASILMLIAKWIEKTMGVVSVVILARLLSPDDYGIAALSQIVVVSFQIILFDGTESYLIRKKNIEKEDYDTAWTVRLIIFIIIGLLIHYLRVDIAYFLKEPRLEEVLVVSSLTVIISGLTNVAIIKYQRELNYLPFFKLSILKKVISFSVTVSIAINYGSYWALVFGLMSMQVSHVILSYILFPYKPSFTVKKISDQFYFTKWIMLGNMTSFVRNKYTELILPKYMGVSSLGQYNMAYQIANMANEYVLTPISHPVYASYSLVQGDKFELSTQFIKAIGILSIIAMPCYLGQQILSTEIIYIILGDKWGNIKNIFEFFLLLVVSQIYISAIVNLLTVLGEVKLISNINWFVLLLLLPFVTYAIVYESIEIVVIYRVKLAIVSLFIFMIALFRNVWIDWYALCFSIIRPMTSAILMAVLLHYLHENYFIDQPIFFIGIEVIIAMGVYIVSILFIWIITGRQIGGERYILEKISLVLKNKKYVQIPTYCVNKLLCNK